MGKKNRQKQGSIHKAEKYRTQSQKSMGSPIQQPTSKLKRYAAALVALIGIGGTCATLYGMRPQPVVVSSVSLNDENPFESQFSIMNNGSIDMQNVRFICFVKSIKTNGIAINNSYAPIAKFPRISAGDTVTLPSFRMQIPSSSIAEADIAIVVKI